jgi:non-ribosomal peptide synthetase component F
MRDLHVRVDRAAKGIVIPHSALVNYVSGRTLCISITRPELRPHSSLTFDLTVTSIFTPLTTGGTVVAYPARGGEPPILDVLRENRADIVKLTPATWRLWPSRA